MHADPNSTRNTTIQARHVLCECWAAVMRVYSPLCLPDENAGTDLFPPLSAQQQELCHIWGLDSLPHALYRCNAALLSLLRPGRKDDGWTLATTYRIRHGSRRTLCGSRRAYPRGARMLGKDDGPPCDDLGRCPYRLSKREGFLLF